MKPELFTIGHSTHSLQSFLDLLRLHRIEAVADVRSNPYSARLPQFGREVLERSLRQAKIHYVFLGAEVGARREERECYVNGIARYDRIAQTGAFQTGLQRIIKGAAQYRLALMCAEKDPLECHRTILVCRRLREALAIRHILSDGSIEAHEASELRLMTEEKVPTHDLFESPLALLSNAYDRRAEKIAYEESAVTSPA